MGSGGLRWWDGGQWTGAVTPSAPAQVAVAEAPAPAQFGYGVPAARTGEQSTGYAPARRYEGLPCQACGGGPAKLLKLYKLRGMVILFVASTRPGRYCATGPFREAQNFTLAWGWWGFITFFLTPVVLVLNWRQVQHARQLPPATGRISPPLRTGPRLTERTGLWLAAVIIPLIVLFLIYR